MSSEFEKYAVKHCGISKLQIHIICYISKTLFNLLFYRTSRGGKSQVPFFDFFHIFLICILHSILCFIDYCFLALNKTEKEGFEPSRRY